MIYTKILLLVVAFIDYLGVGLIYPMFSSMIFDPEYPLIEETTSQAFRGFCLGALLAIMPLIQFFSAPLWGALSDIKGRKSPLIQSLFVAFLGYCVAYFGARYASLILLFASRALIGLASGNVSIIQASLSDISDASSRTKNFGLYSMALGSGFTLGPLAGGLLSHFGYQVPFLFASCAVAINLIFAYLFLKDTLEVKDKISFKFRLGLSSIQDSIAHKPIRGTFFSLFLHNFGWSYFFEFIPVFLFGVMHFSRQKLGIFYAIAGLFYALSTGLLIRPFIKKYQPLSLFRFGLIFSGLVIVTMGFIKHDFSLWICLFALCFFVSFVTPSATSYVSSHCEKKHEGRVLGSLNSMNAVALILAPLISGIFVGDFPKMPVFLGGSMMIGASLVSFLFQRKDQSL
jgi:MFS transporter, DHA1 family, tetracycline resistance protein